MIPLYIGEEAALKYLQQSTRRSSDETLQIQVHSILAQVKASGDTALRTLAAQFGDALPPSFCLPSEQVQAAVTRVSPETKSVLDAAADNISTFAKAIMASVQPVSLKRGEFSVGLDWKPIERVACYVPGGRYPLPSTALMTALTAQVAGVPQIVMVSPQFQDETLYAGTLAGVSTFYQLGGAQAIAALAYGTESIHPVDMVVGPGNAYVTEAKRQLQGMIGIDMLAGPSEVAIVADDSASPAWVALDLLAQAEHDPRARAWLFTPSRALAESVQTQVPHDFQRLQLPAFVEQALSGSGLFVLPSLSACVHAVNQMAPEHLVLHVDHPEALKPQLHHYGALFMGHLATVPFGDYMAGPNHTLPTSQTARFSGGLTPLTFLRPQTWFLPGQEVNYLAKRTAQFAALEGLQAHASAALARGL